MSLPKPNLDDKTFQEFLEDEKKIIPIFAPEWTDYNVHDPGITFVELFAWLAEMQIYRLNQITDKNRLKFLKMLGETPRSANSAIVDVTFTNTGSSLINVPQNTQLAALNQDQPAEMIVFETTKEINIVSQKITRIVSQDIYGITDNTSANEMEGHYFYAFGKTAGNNSTMYLGFEESLPLGKMDIMVYLYEKDLIERGRHGEEPLKICSSVNVVWEYFNEAKNEWISLGFDDETLQYSFSGSISLQIPSDMNKYQLPLHPTKDYNLYWIRCRVTLEDPLKDGFEIPPRIEAIKMNTVNCLQQEEFNGDNGNGVNLGSSNGLPNQVFCLPLIPLESQSHQGNEWCQSPTAENWIKDESTTIFSIDEANNQTQWIKFDDFAASKENDHHFVLNFDKGQIIFGDGINGMIPPIGNQINAKFSHIYREKGNVATHQINQILEDDLKGLEVFNERQATGGSNPETIEEAVIRVRKDLRTPYTAVISVDYEELAKSTPGLRVRRAKALADKIKNLVNVLVVPECDPENISSKPNASRGFLKTVCKHLDKHRLITTQVMVENPQYVEVTVNATVKPKLGYDGNKLKKNAVDSLNNFINPFIGGDDGMGWPFGRDVFSSEIYEVLDEVDGVDCVFQVKLMVNGRKLYGKTIKVDENELVYSGKHNISILGLEEECGRGKYL